MWGSRNRKGGGHSPQGTNVSCNSFPALSHCSFRWSRCGSFPMSTGSYLGAEICPHLLLALTLVHLLDPVSRLREWHRDRCPRWRGICRRVPSLYMVPVSLYRQNMSLWASWNNQHSSRNCNAHATCPWVWLFLVVCGIPLDMRRSVLACKVQGWVPHITRAKTRRSRTDAVINQAMSTLNPATNNLGLSNPPKISAGPGSWHTNLMFNPLPFQKNLFQRRTT